jgi:transcriptional regulator with XRE-family HTH domain
MAKKRKEPPETPPEPANPWPARLKALRERFKLTQAETAAKVGVSLRAYGKWERGQQLPTLSHQILIALLEEGKF